MAINNLVIIISLIVSLIVIPCRASIGEPRRTCEQIEIQMCRGIGYNRTYMPNQFNHKDQQEAAAEANQFWPLVHINCSPDLKFFLCSMYTPICIDDYTKPLPACREVCERARAGCIRIMNEYGFDWPAHFDCANLPRFGNPDALCMDANQTEKNSHSNHHQPQPQPPSTVQTSGNGGVPMQHLPAPPPTPSISTSMINNDKGGRRKNPINNNNDMSALPGFKQTGTNNNNKRCECTTVQCSKKKSFKFVEGDAGAKLTVAGNITGCAYACKGALGVDAGNYEFIHFWIGIWATICCASTLLIVLTFAIDMSRFRYPERPIIFLSFCYFMVSVGYIIRLIAKHEAVACEDDHIRSQNTGSALCTVVFIFIYFFGMASSVWWVNLSLTWFLAAGLKWSNEAIAGYSQYFHIFAWALPSIKTVAILTLSGVDGDPVSGICYVGNTDVNMLRFFVLGPLFAYLVLGSFFLLSGFVSLLRIHNMVKQQQMGGVLKIDKLEKLMVRIGIFSVLYTIPATIVVGCYFYEQHYRIRWELTSLCDNVEICESHNRFKSSNIDFSVFCLKYFMCLVVGITSGVWIWTPKTLSSWRRFFANRFCCCCCPMDEDSRSNTTTINIQNNNNRSNNININANNLYSNNNHHHNSHNGQAHQLLLGNHQQLAGPGAMIGVANSSASPRDFYDYNNGCVVRTKLSSGGGPPSTSGGGYMPTDAMIIKSHTDISSGCYSRQYPVNHV